MALWTDEMHGVLISCFKKQILNGKGGESGLKKAGWTLLREDFNRLTGLSYEKDQLQSQISSIKKKYQTFLYLKEKSCFDWDEEKDIPIASDAVWEAEIAANKDVKEFKTKTLPFYTDLHEIFTLTQSFTLEDQNDDTDQVEIDIAIATALGVITRSYNGEIDKGPPSVQIATKDFLARYTDKYKIRDCLRVVKHLASHVKDAEIYNVMDHEIKDMFVSEIIAKSRWIQVEKGQLSRVLYPNPVCILSVWDEALQKAKTMTITWLTPINNKGGFICSVNMKRHTASYLSKAGSIFVLNVPVKGMEELVLNIGGCTGSETDKVKAFNIKLCPPGHMSSESTCNNLNKKVKLSKQDLARQEMMQAHEKSIALEDCVAHVLCRVDIVTLDDGHYLLKCTQLAAWVKEKYWDGRNLTPQSIEEAPYLTFLGSQKFGYVVPSAPKHDIPR